MINSELSAKTILVTGATGNIGKELLTQLVKHADVRAATRDTAAAVFPAGVEPVEADLRHAHSLKSALDGVSSLFLVSRVDAHP
ncbi:NAD(P)H-binding protein [Nocardia sp. NPDC052278]|uniref:NmrA family NAD(P)-binding protein n=1 Tax=unclassified Nocardia TaxID=2637762 RepID=UPI0036A8A232